MPFCVAQLSSSPPLFLLLVSVLGAWMPCMGAMVGSHMLPSPVLKLHQANRWLYTEKTLLKWLKSQLFLSFPWLRLGRSAVSVQWWVTLITYPQSQIWKGWLHIKLIVLLSKFLQSHARSCLRFSIPNIQPTDLKKNRKEGKFPLVSWRVWCRIPFFYEIRRDHTWLFSFVKS